MIINLMMKHKYKGYILLNQSKTKFMVVLSLAISIKMKKSNINSKNKYHSDQMMVAHLKLFKLILLKISKNKKVNYLYLH